MAEEEKVLNDGFGRKFEELRLKMNLNQTELAEKLGISPGMVSKYENGDNYPSVEILIKLRKMGGNIGALFGDREIRFDALISLHNKFADLVGLSQAEEELFNKFKADKAELYQQIKTIIDGK